MRRTFVSLVAAASLMAFVDTAEASCGVDCSWPSRKTAKKPSLGEVQLFLRHTDFAMNAGKGSYQESLLRLQYTGLNNTRLGLWVAHVVACGRCKAHRNQ